MQEEIVLLGNSGSECEAKRTLRLSAEQSRAMYGPSVMGNLHVTDLEAQSRCVCERRPKSKGASFQLLLEVE